MGKILDTATKAESLRFETYRIRALLSSPGSGAGKTTAACSIPGRKLLIDIDNRSESVAEWPDVEVVKCHEADPKSPKAWQRLDNIRKELWALAHPSCTFPYAAVIPDGNTALFRVCMNWALLLDPAPLL